MYVSTSPGKQPTSGGGTVPAPKPSRRVFSPEYKLAMVTEYENAPNGEKGAILRREGLYSSHIIEWTRARDAGQLGGLHGSKTDIAAAAGQRGEEVSGADRVREAASAERETSSGSEKTRMALDKWERHMRSWKNSAQHRRT